MRGDESYREWRESVNDKSQKVERKIGRMRESERN